MGQQLRRLVGACLAPPQPTLSSSINSRIGGVKYFDEHKKAKPRVVLLGLDGAGKSCLLDRLIDPNGDTATDAASLKSKTTNSASSSVGCCVRSALSFDIVDVPGAVGLRPLWRYYAAPRCDNAQAIVFVVDAADRARLGEAGHELGAVLDGSVELSGAPLLALANKRDLPGCASLAEIRDALRLDLLAEGRPCQLLAVSAVTGQGLLEARQLLAQLVDDNRRLARRRRRRSHCHQREIWRTQRVLAPALPPPYTVKLSSHTSRKDVDWEAEI